MSLFVDRNFSHGFAVIKKASIKRSHWHILKINLDCDIGLIVILWESD